MRLFLSALLLCLALPAVAQDRSSDTLDAPAAQNQPRSEGGIDDLDRGEQGEPSNPADDEIDDALRRRELERQGEDYDPGARREEDNAAAPADVSPPPLAAPQPEPQPAQDAVPPARADLVIASWGGAYQAAQKLALAEPFAKEQGEQIAFISHDGTPAGLRRLIEGPDAPDLVDLDADMARALCREGLIAELDPGLAGDAADYLPASLSRCAIGSMAWSALILTDKRLFPKRPPTQVADLFDLKRFPGKRAFLRDGRYALEMAVLADGVAPENVYWELKTPAGYARALGRLEAMRNQIIWADSAAEVINHLRESRAVMGIGYSGRAFQAVVAERAPIGLVWSGQVRHVDMWAIPARAKHAARAREFLSWAVAPERLAAQTRLMPYGPVRISALAQVDRHAEIDVPLRGFLPTVPENAALAVNFDGEWWRDNQADVAARIAAWPAWVEPKPAPVRSEGRSRRRR